MTDTNALLPCPFCGERAETDFIPEHHSYQVECRDVFGCTARVTRDSELGAVEAWNCRAPAPAPTDAAPEGPVARIEGIDEYGPRLEWTQHWVDVGVGAKLYTASQVQAMLARAETGAHQCRTLTSQTTTKPPTEAVFIA